MDGHNLYRAIVETSPDAIWVTDLDGATLYANIQMARLYGVDDADRMQGVTMTDVLDATGRRQWRAHLADLSRGEFDLEAKQCLLHDRLGRPQWVLVRESPLYDDHGRLHGLLHRLTEFDEHRRIHDELEASRARLAEAQRIARVGSFRWELDSGDVELSDMLREMAGLVESDLANPIEDFLGITHPDDLEEVGAALEPLLRSGERCDFVARVHSRSAGEHLWVRLRAVGRTDAHGRVVVIEGTAQDVTEQVGVEEALRDQVSQNTLMQAVASAANQARSLRELLRGARDLVLLHDDWSRARGFNVEDGELSPLYVDDADRLADEADPAPAAADLALAQRVAEVEDLVWDERRLSIGFPVRLDGELLAVVVITSDPPLYRHRMIEDFVRQAMVQLEHVARREHAAREVAEARDAAMTANRQKSDFLAMVSHEIRTPLNGVIGLNELLQQTALTEEQRTLATGAGLSGRLLLDLINDLLDFSKIEAGQLHLEQLDFDLRGVLEQVVRPLVGTATGKGIELEVEVDPRVPEVLRGDPTRLSQVVVNLVSNAVKFTETGRVDLVVGGRATEAGGWLLEVAVSDTGTGIPADVTDLFEPFQQAASSTNRTHGGTGLGLAISREIVTLAGGDIGYSSVFGQGSQFWFTMPTTAPQGQQVVGRPHPDQRLHPQGPARRVLVVDDNPVNRLVAEGMVKALGHHVDPADDGLAALQLLRQSTYDAVLLDVQMPRLDGYGVARALREDPATRDLPVIAMTATAVDGERERCLAAGMDDFLTKPLDPVALSRILGRWLDDDERPVTAPVVTAPPRPDLDLVRLDVLRDLVPGSTAYLDRAISNFLTGCQDALATLEQAVRAGDAARLRFHAHSLKGSASNLGATEVARVAERLERLGAEDEARGAGGLLLELAEALDAACDGLRAYRDHGYVAASA